jgi:predicted alpha/beta superfamily hydrolase
MRSEALKESRTLLVHVPDGYKNSDVRYPVLYLLDGESHFTKTVGILDFLSRTAGNELVPQMIVVAIVHNDRERELVPPVYEAGKADKDAFARFLEKELIPYVDAKYPTAPYRVFVGHSLGGLRVINTVVYQPGLFNAAIALDPSLGHVRTWVDRGIADFNKVSYNNRSLYIAMGMTMPQGMDTAVIFRDTSSNARHMRSIMKFSYNASRKTNNGLDMSWKYYPDESHQSVVFKGTYDGLVSVFSWYKNEHLYDIFKPDVNPTEAAKVMTNYYERLSGKMGYKMYAPEQGISELIDYLLFKKWYDKAYAFAELNARNYPDSKRAANRLNAVQWQQKPPITVLLETRSAAAVAEICRKQATMKEPEYNISEEAINTLGYEMIAQNKVADAAVLLKLNVDLYPKSDNVYDSYGEVLLLQGKKEEAIKAYSRAVELNPNNTNAGSVLEKLRQ